MLSKKAKYSIRALLHLGREQGKGPVLIRDIAEKEQIPRKFLEAILLELRNEGIIHSKLGKGGGYYLERNPDTITLGRLIRLIDGPLAPVSCVSQTAYAPCKDCLSEKACVIRHVMKQVRDSYAKILDDMTLQMMLAQEKELETGNPSTLDFCI